MENWRLKLEPQPNTEYEYVYLVADIFMAAERKDKNPFPKNPLSWAHNNLVDLSSKFNSSNMQLKFMRITRLLLIVKNSIAILSQLI